MQQKFETIINKSCSTKIGDSYLYKAKKSERTGNLEEAIKAYKTAIKANPTLGWGYFLLGELLSYYKSNTTESMELYEKALAFTPNSKLFYERFQAVTQLSSSEMIAIQTWHNFINNRINNISKANAQMLQESVDKNFIDKYIYGEPEIIKINANKVEQNSLGNRFSDKEKKHFFIFLRKICTSDFSISLIQSILQTNNQLCHVPNPLGKGYAKCRESFFYSGRAHALRFVTPGGETFFIIQQNTSANAIYFPTRSVIYMKGDVDKNSVLVDYLCNNFIDVLEYTLKSVNNQFGGILASNGRPYHFYHDLCLSLYFLYQKNLLSQIPAIYQRAGENLFDLGKLFNIENCKYIDFHLMANKAKNDQEFYIEVGKERYSSPNYKTEHEQISNMIVNVASQTVDSQTIEEIKKAKECFPLLWFGVTGQKRAWLEQVEGGAKIINELANIYPNLGVVFDGWTSPESAIEKDIAAAKQDQAVVDRIIKLLSPKINTFSVVGETTVNKLAWAKIINAFITNYGTGSIHVARFAKKPGVGHMSNQGLRHMRKQLIHYRTITIPEEQVKDYPNPKKRRVDFVNYSIAPEIILEKIKEVLKRECDFS